MHTLTDVPHALPASPGNWEAHTVHLIADLERKVRCLRVHLSTDAVPSSTAGTQRSTVFL
jgi:hypothetical protein